MNHGTPIDVMTVDQVLAIKRPSPKRIPDRPLGPPRSREEVQGIEAAERAYAHHRAPVTPDQAVTPLGTSRPMTFADYQPPSAAAGYVSPDVGFTSPPSVTIGLPNTTAAHPSSPPRARLKPFLVSPTDPNHRGPLIEPCRAVIELEFEVPEVGIVICPVTCTIERDHPNQPHIGRVFGAFPEDDPQRHRAGHPVGDVFVGWQDEGIRS